MKLTSEQVKEIRDRIRKKEKQTSIAARFNISESHVSLIRSNKRRTKHATS